MKLVNEPVSRSTCPGLFVGGFPKKNSAKLIPATALGYICDPDDDSYFPLLPNNISVLTERDDMALVKFIDVK
ncbi:hypothetical protein A0J61_10330 [Choanephora cucurbitarum]|uniref:Uncharacterized protein n=1 Tax=Choanephora cucurbitarum TaxID=101091 RepID=A0A1C7MXX8_9FUNG|nr:hypothetical protein A0J61_10330 [Choanephora cucurbitarum]